MPLYEYECDACGCRFEVILKSSDTAVETCTHCGKGPVHRQLSSPAIQFKGSGWYVTDYAQKGKTDSSTSSSAKDSDAAKSDNSAPKSESGGASKSDSGSTPKSDTATSASKPSAGSTSKDSKA